MSGEARGVLESEVPSPGRRRFIGQAGVAAGAAIAASVLPPMAHAATLAISGEPAIRPAAHADSARLEAEASWHIDDMWGHWPRYAHPIPHAGAAASPIDWEHVDPIDRMLLI